MNEPALLVENLFVNYEKSPVLWDVSFSIPKGKMVAIAGPNGAGKSTLIKAVLNLVKPTSGKVSFYGLPFKEMRGEIAYVPQKENVDWDFPITVSELVLMGRYGKRGLFRMPNSEDRAKAFARLKEVDMDRYAKRQINALSGGEKQRVFMARALAQEADIYFLDEPFVGIDVCSTKVIIELLFRLRSENKTIFVVHHDLSSIPEIFDWVVFLNQSVVGAGEVEEVFTPEMIQRTYGHDTQLIDRVARLLKDKYQGFPGEKK